jgi:hypothetical protein
LSLAWGIPVSEVRERVSVHELSEWFAFERVFGPLTVQERVDVAGATAAYATAKLGGSRGTELSSFIPKWESAEARPKQTPQQMMAFIRGIQARQRKR